MPPLCSVPISIANSCPWTRAAFQADFPAQRAIIVTSLQQLAKRESQAFLFLGALRRPSMPNSQCRSNLMTLIEQIKSRSITTLQQSRERGERNGRERRETTCSRAQTTRSSRSSDRQEACTSLTRRNDAHCSIIALHYYRKISHRNSAVIVTSVIRGLFLKSRGTSLLA